jgi:uncharacterized protein YeaO (DUF488 family)
MLTTYRYGSPRSRDELLRIGAARQVPRGVPREDWQRLGYFDVWMPLLAPSAELRKEYRGGALPFEEFAHRYRKEMTKRESRQVIELLAAMLPFQPISVGCYCEDESLCHRSVLRALIEEEARERGLAFSSARDHEGQYASPVCYAYLEKEHHRSPRRERPLERGGSGETGFTGLT